MLISSFTLPKLWPTAASPWDSLEVFTPWYDVVSPKGRKVEQSRPAVPTAHRFLHKSVKCNCKYCEVSAISGWYTASESLVAAQCLCVRRVSVQWEKADDTAIMWNHFHPLQWLTRTSPNRIYISSKMHLRYPFLSQQIIRFLLRILLWMTTIQLRAFLPEVAQGWRLCLSIFNSFGRTEFLSLTGDAEMQNFKGSIFPFHWMTEAFSHEGGFLLQLRSAASTRSIYRYLKALTHLLNSRNWALIFLCQSVNGDDSGVV